MVELAMPQRLASSLRMAQPWPQTTKRGEKYAGKQRAVDVGGATPLT
jgi:hypothetical protein